MTNIKNILKVSAVLLLPLSFLAPISTTSNAAEVPIIKSVLLSPKNNSSYTSTRTSIEVEIEANREHILNDEVEALLVSTNTPTIDEFKLFDRLHAGSNIAAVSKPIIFTTLNQKIKVKFENATFLYSGDNYYYLFLRTKSHGGIYFRYKPSADFTLKYTGSLAPLYRFWSFNKNGHFFTKNSEEKDIIISNDQTWDFENIAYYVGNTQGENCIGKDMKQIYRFWSESYQHHFYTASASERDSIKSKDKNWAYEGVAFCAASTKIPGSSEVYRFYSKSKNAHFFTINLAEKESIIKNDSTWAYEGIAYYAFK